MAKSYKFKGLDSGKTITLTVGQRMTLDELVGVFQGLDEEGNGWMKTEDGDTWSFNPKGFYDQSFQKLK